jgi:drug/metabolite transporter (DMT)-like permease
MTGIAVAIASSISYGLNNIAIRRGVLASSASFGLYFTVFAGTLFAVVAALVTGDLFQAGVLSVTDWLLLVMAGLVQIMLGRYCFFKATHAFGAPRTDLVQGLQIPASILLAMAVLGERPEASSLAGAGLIMFSGVVMVSGSRKPTRARQTPPADVAVGVDSARRAPDVRMAEGYGYALASMGLYTGAGVLFKAAIGDTGLGTLGGLIAYTSAAAVLGASLLLKRYRDPLRGASMRAARWFTATAILSFLANTLRFVALGLAPISVVEPLIRTSAAFTFLFSLLINRRLETLGVREAVSVVLSLAGLALILL